MNFINFTGSSNFPLSSDTMAFLQKMVTDLGVLAKIGGDNYILSGCQESGNSVSSGVVVMNGIPYAFGGGAKQNTVYLKEVKRSVNAMGYSFADVYASRSVEFGIGNLQKNWSEFKRLPTNQELQVQIDNLVKELESLRGIPTGIICMWSGSVNNIPAGWVLCNGDNGTPDLKGRFVVGYSVSDTDYNAVGKANSNAKTMVLTEKQMPKHRHVYSDDDVITGGMNVDGASFPSKAGDTKASTESKRGSNGRNTIFYTTYAGGGEAVDKRPPYFVLAYIMKV